MWHSRQASVNTFPYVSLFTKDDDRARRPLHSVAYDRNVLGIFVPLPPAVLIAFTHEGNIALEAGSAKFCFQCCANRVSLTVTKHLDFCCTFYKADVTSRALSSHFVSCF